MERANYKGVGVVYARTLYREMTGPEQARLREALGADLTHALETASASAWMPLTTASVIFEEVSKIVFSDAVQPIRALGEGMARHNLTFVYRTVLRVIKPSLFLAQYKRLWSLYHRDGVASMTVKGHGAFLEISQHPNIPESFRECTAGWMTQAMNLAGASQVWVSVEPEDAGAYSWRMRWRE